MNINDIIRNAVEKKVEEITGDVVSKIKYHYPDQEIRVVDDNNRRVRMITSVPLSEYERFKGVIDRVKEDIERDYI